MTEIDEVASTLERLNGELQELLIRGIRVCGPEHLSALKGIQGELARVGAEHLAERLHTLIAAIENDDRSAASALMQTQASLRVFERVLTLQVAEQALAACLRDSDESEVASDSISCGGGDDA